jgi:splicing factor U2AF subunit
MIPHVNAGNSIMNIDQLMMQQVFDDFLEEIVEELNKFGRLEDVQVVENLGDHMIGNVYAKYEDEEDAEKACKAMNGRFYAGRQLSAEFTGVTDFAEARCKQYDEDQCDRGPFCNFIHVRSPCKKLKEYLKEEFRFDICNTKGSATMASYK